MIGMIAASPSSGAKPRSRSAPRNQVVFSRRRATRSGRSSEDADGGAGAAGDRRGKRVREELRAGALREQVAHLRRGGDVAAGRAAECLAERPGRHVDLAEHAEVLRDAAPGLADDADAVRVVDDDDRVVGARELEDVGQLREVALHREDAVGEDQLPLPRLAGGERVAQLGHVGMAVAHLPLRLGEPHRVDDRGVVQLVGEDHGRARRRASGSPPRSRSSRRRT